MKIKNTLLPIMALLCGQVYAQIPEGFDADAIYVLVDSDLKKRSYSDVTMTNDLESKDQLLIMRKGADTKPVSFDLVNSMKGFSNQAVLNYDGRYVMVSSGDSAPDGYASYTSEKGLLSVLDTKHGTIVEEKLNSKAGPVAINHMKGLLAVAAGSESNMISLLIWKGRAVTNMIEVPLKGLEGKDKISDLIWSQTGNLLAVTFEYSNKVAFYRLTNNAEGISLELKGKPLTCGVNPGLGVFSQDETLFFVADQNEAFKKGAVAVVKVDMISGQHEFLQSVPTNIGPEMIRLSPDGKNIITVNRRGAHLAESDKNKTRMSSLTVFKILKSGKLKPLGEYPFKTVYPSDLRFDKSGEMIAVVAHESAFDDSKAEVLFWDFNPNKKIQLKIRGARLELPKGAHSIFVQ